MAEQVNNTGGKAAPLLIETLGSPRLGTSLSRMDSLASQLLHTGCWLQTCPSVDNIAKTLSFHHDLTQVVSAKDHDDPIMRHFEENPRIMDDYHHIQRTHLDTGDESRDNKNYAEMHKNFAERLAFDCDIKSCSTYRLNYLLQLESVESEQQKEQKLDLQLDALDALEYTGTAAVRYRKQFLDQLHVYFLHSVDMGYRSEWTQTPAVADNKAEESGDQQEALDSVDVFAFSRNQTQFQPFSSIAKKSSKFSTKINQKHLSKEIVKIHHEPAHAADKDKESNDLTAAASTAAAAADNDAGEMTLYSFGFRFYYWDFYKSADASEAQRKMYVAPKHKDFKEEMAEYDKIDIFYIKDRTQAWAKVSTLMAAKETRKLTSHVQQAYGIKENGRPISEKHVMAVVLYTDYPHLSTEFSSTFRITDEDLNGVEDTKKRNAKYREWSRLLREAVECYGTTINEYKDQRISTKNPVFFHGVSKVYFDSFTAKFCCPTSTTSNKNVAHRFTHDDGIILSLTSLSGFDSLRFFDCQFFSNYPEESEQLFIGGRQPLEFYSIVTRLATSSPQNLKLRPFVKALCLFDKITHGRLLSTEETGKVAARDAKIINCLIENATGLDRLEMKEKKTLPPYIVNCFKAFLNNKTDVVSFNIDGFRKHYPQFQRIFMDDKHFMYNPVDPTSNNLLDFDYIARVFKECVEIQSLRTDPPRNEHTGQAFLYLEALSTMLERINQIKDCKLRRIRLLRKNELDDPKMLDQFRIVIPGKTGWNISVHGHELLLSK